MAIKTLQVSCLMFILFSPCARAEPSQNSAPVENRQLFSHIEDAVSKVKTVSGDFVQERRTDLLDELLVSEGHFYFEPPDRLLWETNKPSISGFAMDGNEAMRWKDDMKFAQAFDINQDPGIRAFADQVFTWMRADFKMLEESYEICVIKESPATIKLIPLEREGQSLLDHLLVIFSSDLSHVVTVKIHEKNGDFTNISFVNVLINRPPLEKLF